MNIKKILSYLEWGKFGENTYKKYSNERTNDNIKRIRIVCLFQVLFNSVLLVCTYVINNKFLTYGYNIYTLNIIINIIVFIIIKRLPVSKEKYISILAYTFILISLITNEFLGTKINNDTIMISISGLYILYSIVFFDKPIRYSLITIVFTIMLCYGSLTIKSIDFAKLDCINCSIFCIVGCILQYYMNGERLEKLILIDEIKEINKTDYLTKLSNRVNTEIGIDEFLKENYDKTNVLFVIDLDNFKNVNDTYGHKSGDQVLIDASKILKKVFRDSDYIARIGGDEFVVFLGNISNENIVEEKAKLIIKEIKEIPIKNNHIVGCSVGVAYSNNNDNYNSLFVKADNAMYEAKNAGKNTYRIKK